MEILVVITIITIALTSILKLVSFSLRASTLIKQTHQANNITQETIEQVRNFRDGTNWNTDGLGALNVSTDYYIQKSGSPLQWQLSEGTETTEGFTQRVVFENVMRDGNDNIVLAGGINDPDTRRVIAAVSWQERGKNHQIELSTYLTNWKQ